MKNILLFLTLAVAVSVAGCTMLKQSNQAHQAIDRGVTDVEKVVVAKKDGVKSATVYVVDEVTDEEKKEIRAIVKEKIPDVTKIRIKPASELPVEKK